MTTTKAAHTPTPWRIKHGYIYGPDGQRLLAADQQDLDTGTYERAANLAYVVRACNAHDDLLAACKFAHSQMSSAGLLCGDIAAAIEKAEAQE